ncbi:hypothetical protein V6N12_067055 [Hibiscus sabdariffa]|uniref:DDE Tnp4 domain-containing protein n=2 Tax=Hibiscus sabdariffa TaxID=183260 RepID=A0ABR2BKT6_9ROSI
MKGTIDASEDWWESRLKVVPEAQRFKSAGIDPEVEGKLDQMFRGIVATGDKAWAPSSGDSMNNNDNSNDDERELNEISQHVQSFNRMSRTVFTCLLRVLETRYNLQSSRNISTLEMLGIFLYILGHGASVSQSRERFQRSGGTISRYFTIMLEKVSQMAIDIIAPEDRSFSSIPEQIRNDSRYMPHFKDCIGAIDGTHISAILPPNEQIPYIGRKGVPTQNVMAVCDFNMCFTFVVAGWEGTAHDTRIFLDAIRDPKLKFPHPPNGLEDADFMEYEKNDRTYEDVDPGDLQDRDSDDDGEVNISSAHEMELMRDAISCSLMNSI